MADKLYGIEKEKYLGGYLVGGDKETFAVEVWDWMIDHDMKSILDVGCGEGHSVKYFVDRGCEAIGIEGGINAISNSPVKSHIIPHDYTKGPFIPNKTYDAIWCCEFVEHVEPKYIDNFLITFTYAQYILMTHAIPGQSGYHHVNCQTDTYWINKLKEIGFAYNQDESLYLRNLTKAKHIQERLLFFYKNI